jgi:hypothetical protein
MTITDYETPHYYRSWSSSLLQIMKLLIITGHEAPHCYRSWSSSLLRIMKLLITTDHEAPHCYRTWRSSLLQIMKLLIITGHEAPHYYRSWSSSLCILLHYCVNLSLLGRNFSLSTLLTKTLSLCSSWVWEEYSQTKEYSTSLARVSY